MRLRRKLFVVLLLGTGATCVAFGAVAWRILASSAREALAGRILAEIDDLASRTTGTPEEGLGELARSAAAGLGLRITLIARDGRVLADSALGAAASTMENHLGRPEVGEALHAGSGRAERRSGTTGEIYHYFARRAGDGGAVAVVRAALPGAELERIEIRHLLVICAAAAGAFVLVSGLAFVLVARLSRPTEEMTAAAERVAAGSLRESVPEPREEELARLAAAMNRMKGMLVSKVDELESEKRLLESLRDGMSEGLLLVGPDRRVLETNAAFRRMMRLPVPPGGKLLGEVVRNPSVVAAIESVLEGAAESRETIGASAGSDQAFEVRVRSVPIPGAGGPRGALALVFDVTRLESLEGVRRRFVADVSHELRTPVTSIKGALETVLDGGLVEDEDARRFLGIARRQADRMGDLIADLTDLSRIETGAVELDRVRVDLGRIVRDAAAAVTTRHAGATVAVNIEIPEGFSVLADPRRLEQIVLNLLDNAVKFNRPGGTVTIDAAREPGIVRISVADTGCGIPEDSIPRIFERFFRADRARSKDVGGTGLGLAIVKHLVHLHGGGIEVRSVIEEGTRIQVRLPD